MMKNNILNHFYFLLIKDRYLHQPNDGIGIQGIMLTLCLPEPQACALDVRVGFPHLLLTKQGRHTLANTFLPSQQCCGAGGFWVSRIRIRIH
jgi:hypothetical protein